MGIIKVFYVHIGILNKVYVVSLKLFINHPYMQYGLISSNISLLDIRFINHIMKTLQGT